LRSRARSCNWASVLAADGGLNVLGDLERAVEGSVGAGVVAVAAVVLLEIEQRDDELFEVPVGLEPCRPGGHGRDDGRASCRVIVGTRWLGDRCSGELAVDAGELAFQGASAATHMRGRNVDREVLDLGENPVAPDLPGGALPQVRAGGEVVLGVLADRFGLVVHGAHRILGVADAPM
jgi:hypothetical protein